VKRIAVEEHFTSREHVSYLYSLMDKKNLPSKGIEDAGNLQPEVRWLKSFDLADNLPEAGTIGAKLIDIGAGRIREMDEAGIDVQVLSLAQPGVQSLDDRTAVTLARRINDELAKAVMQFPGRFYGLATIAPQAPAEAASELRRAITELGLRGVLINSHTRGEYLDDEKFWIILETVEELGVPLYIHPAEPSPDMIKPYLAYPGLSGAINGFCADVSLHTLRMIFGGVFDRFPRLQIILGHLGEGLPYWMSRIDDHWLKQPQTKKLGKKPSDYIRDNFFVTMSGMYWHPALLCAYLALGADRILFAVDYPMEPNLRAVASIESAPICTIDKEKILYSNAEKLFRL